MTKVIRIIMIIVISISIIAIYLHHQKWNKVYIDELEVLQKKSKSFLLEFGMITSQTWPHNFVRYE